MKILQPIVTILFVLASIPLLGQGNKISINLSQPQPMKGSVITGISIDETNRGTDGGLYAEMLANRSFDDKSFDSACYFKNGYLYAPHKPHFQTGLFADYKMKWDTLTQCPGWELKWTPGSRIIPKIESSTPQSKALHLQIVRATKQEMVMIDNPGLNGLNLQKGETYTLRLRIKFDKTYKDTFLVKLINENAKLVAEQTFTKKDADQWTDYEATLKATRNTNEGRLSLAFVSNGNIWIDYVSLFPTKTFRNRKNGMQASVGEKLADAKPSFVKWPGDIEANGFTLEERVQWKQTLGNPTHRKGHLTPWRYYNSNGLGYDEFLQFAEDLGASAMYVCNAGIASATFNGDYCPEDGVSAYVQEALDAIEYAIGDTSTTWGRQRKQNGHAAAYPLKYVQVGGDLSGEMYNQRFAKFYKAIKQQWPQIAVIATSQTNTPADFVSQSLTTNPDKLFSSIQKDTIFEQAFLGLFISELTSLTGLGDVNMQTSLSEALVLMEAERKASQPILCTPPALLENEKNKTVPGALILANENDIAPRSAYYVFQLFQNNRIQTLYPTSLTLSGKDIPANIESGFVGLSTIMAGAQFKNIRISQQNKQIYRSNFPNNEQDWDPQIGNWRIEDSVYTQSSDILRRVSILQGIKPDAFSASLDIKRTKGSGGIAVIFGGKDKNNYYQLAIGTNQYTKVEKVTNGISLVVSDSVKFELIANQWHRLQAQFAENRMACLVDGVEILNSKLYPTNRRFVSAGKDSLTGNCVVKIINAEPYPFQTEIDFTGISHPGSKGYLKSVSSNSLNNENTLEKPSTVKMEEKEIRTAKTFPLTCKPNSFTIIRIP
jgi:alpha-L-arabinofuranosidase